MFVYIRSQVSTVKLNMLKTKLYMIEKYCCQNGQKKSIIFQLNYTVYIVIKYEWVKQNIQIIQI